MNREEIEELLALAVWLLAVEIRQAKEEIMTTLDEAVSRIQTDVGNMLSAFANLKAEIDALGNTDADVTNLNAAAQQMEDALSNIGPTLGQVTPPTDGTDQPPADDGSTPPADGTDQPAQ